MLSLRAEVLEHLGITEECLQQAEALFGIAGKDACKAHIDPAKDEYGQDAWVLRTRARGRLSWLGDVDTAVLFDHDLAKALLFVIEEGNTLVSALQGSIEEYQRALDNMRATNDEMATLQSIAIDVIANATQIDDEHFCVRAEDMSCLDQFFEEEYDDEYDG